MLRWSMADLAENSLISERTIARLEAGWGRPKNTHVETLYRLIDCFEAQGITFIWDDGSPEGPGVRWGRYPGRQQPAE
jgi:predicted transcriptional regulator